MSVGVNLIIFKRRTLKLSEMAVHKQKPFFSLTNKPDTYLFFLLLKKFIKALKYYLLERGGNKVGRNYNKVFPFAYSRREKNISLNELTLLPSN